MADARVNVEGIPNVELRQARTEDVLAELAEGGVDAVLLDPPRAGCMTGTLDALLDAPPERVVYVSCDPETLARDLAILTAGPFRIEQVRPVDMFPQTHHVEAVGDARPRRRAAGGGCARGSRSCSRRPPRAARRYSNGWG